MSETGPKYTVAVTAAVSLVFLIYFGNPAVALLTGMALSLVFRRSTPVGTGTAGKYALQTAIVLLGFRLNVKDLWEISGDYSLAVTVYVLLTICIGLALGWIFRNDNISNKLIASGTAICGGTTIASLAPIVHAQPQQTAVALALVFLLNAAALFSFPLIGDWLNLSQQQFGVWCALAIHDTSSVVATAAIYGNDALEIATTIKLGRTLWLIPLLLVFSMIEDRTNAGLRLPGFIVLFVGASVFGSVIALPAMFLDISAWLSKALLVFALFCIGTELKRDTLRELKGAAALQAIGLWLFVAPITLAAVFYLI